MIGRWCQEIFNC
jgi:chromosome segregation ATPase